MADSTTAIQSPTMAQSIQPPAHRSLLPPLLACLPTAFASPRPPPALLPLLSPILRQRVNLRSADASSPSDSWLTKLAWDPQQAEKLTEVVESDAFELHPVSNEIEFEEVEDVIYRRLDEETLHAKVAIRDLRLVVIYLWCVGDTEGGGDGWRVAELLPFDGDNLQPNQWSSSLEEADRKHADQTAASNPSQNTPSISIGNGMKNGTAVEDDDDDDDYWAQYDNAPTSTPGPQPSPGPEPPKARHGRTTSEAEYFARYAQIQPDMDTDDPSIDRDAIGESSLQGNSLLSAASPAPAPALTPSPQKQNLPNGTTELAAPHPLPAAIAAEVADVERPGSSSSSVVVDKLEGSAMVCSHTELAVRQHVASSMKSLYRLCHSIGMQLGEFDALVKREVEVLGFEERMEEG